MASTKYIVPRIENRSLRISKNLEGFEYSRRDCKNQKDYNKKKKWEKCPLVIDFYPFKDKQTMESFRTMGKRLR